MTIHFSSYCWKHDFFSYKVLNSSIFFCSTELHVIQLSLELLMKFSSKFASNLSGRKNYLKWLDHIQLFECDRYIFNTMNYYMSRFVYTCVWISLIYLNLKPLLSIWWPQNFFDEFLQWFFFTKLLQIIL